MPYISSAGTADEGTKPLNHLSIQADVDCEENLKEPATYYLLIITHR